MALLSMIFLFEHKRYILIYRDRVPAVGTKYTAYDQTKTKTKRKIATNISSPCYYHIDHSNPRARSQQREARRRQHTDEQGQRRSYWKREGAARAGRGQEVLRVLCLLGTRFLHK